MILQLDKISLKEACNNDNGRTSSKKLIGLLSSAVCIILLVALVIFYFTHTGDAIVILQFIDKIIMVFGISAGLLGVKSVANAIGHRYGYPGPTQPSYPTAPPQYTDNPYYSDCTYYKNNNGDCYNRHEKHHNRDDRYYNGNRNNRSMSNVADEYQKMIQDNNEEDLNS